MLDVLSSILAGLAVFTLSYVALTVVADSKELAKKKKSSEYEQNAVETLRAQSSVFRNAETLVRSLAKGFETSPTRHEFDYCLQIKGDSPPWTAPLFLATKLIEALIAGCGAALFLMIILPSPVVGIMFGGVFAMLVYFITIKSYQSEANELKKRIKARLPFVVDLMALTRGAGASFEESLKITVEENEDSPIGDVFERVLHDFTLGQSEREAMDALSERMQDWDFSELVFTINRGAAFGVPIADALATLANQMRLKRQQWIEQAAGQAQARILFPGVIVMIACMLIILAPFALMWLNNDATSGGFMMN